MVNHQKSPSTPHSVIINSDIAISVKNISKKYQLYESPKHRMKEALHPFKKKYHREFWAVKDVSFEARKGETIGIIGRNGSGKSTLLQMICGTLTPTQGNVIVNGRVSALLELGAGFNRQYTGKENVYMNGAIMGLSRQKIDERYQEIVDFAEIGNFINQPVKTYSSGMYVRLAFACAIYEDPEILIVDEALAVGDAKFQRKCHSKLQEFRNKNKTILFVSHNTSIISQICNHAILLEKGHIVEEGAPKEVTRLYHKMLFGEESNPAKKTVEGSKVNVSGKPQNGKKDQLMKKKELERKRVKDLAVEKQKKSNAHGHSDEMRYGNKKVEIIDHGIIDCNGEKTVVLETGKNYIFFSRVIFYEELKDIILGCSIVNKQGLRFFGTNTDYHKVPIPKIKEGDVVEVQFQITMYLAPGEFFLTFGASPEYGKFYDRRVDAIHFRVINTSKTTIGPLVNLSDKIMIRKF